MKMVKSVYKKILDNVPTHMPETGGMLGGQDGTVTKVVFDDGKDLEDAIIRQMLQCLIVVLWNGVKVELNFMDCFILISTGCHHCQKEMKYILKRYWRQCHNPRKSCSFRLLFCRIKKYRCCLDGSNLVVAEDPVMCVADFEK